MEYLMTYGWAILIIAIALSALFALGVFSPNAFAPKASPGSCSILRPDGPRTVNFISASGLCNGEMPKFVFSNGSSPYDDILVKDSSFNATFANHNALSASAWIYELPNDECEVSLLNIYPKVGWVPDFIFRFGVSGGAWAPNRVLLELFTTSAQTNMFSSETVPYNEWVNIAATYNGTEVNFYVNGVFAGSASYTGPLSTGPGSVLSIGTNFNSGCSSYFPGFITNVQLYNTALTQNGITALYQEGLGGTPINLPRLVGWWPLNSNANDYSGNGYNGTASGVTYSSSYPTPP